MSTFIDPYRPYSEEDKEWLRTRAGAEALIDANDRQFGYLSEEEKAEVRAQVETDDKDDQEALAAAIAAQAAEDEDAFDEEDLAIVAPLSTVELRARLKKAGQNSEGSKDELQIRLLEFLEDQRG